MKEWSWRFQSHAGLAGPHWDLAKAHPSPSVPFLAAALCAHECHVDSPISAGSCSWGTRWAVWDAQVVQAFPVIAWAVPQEAEEIALS